MKRRIVAGAVALLLLTIPARAFFPVFGGVPVIDSANLAENVIHTAKFVAQIGLMTQTYNKISQQYSHMVHQAKQIMDVYRSVRYRIPATVWRGIAARDNTGRIGRWIDAVNSGISTVEAWEKATIRIATLPASIAGLPGIIRERLETEAGTIDLQDGAAISAIDTLGRIRVAGPQIESALLMLENDSLSTDPELHTEAAQMNKANAIALIQARALTDQNKLLVTNTELALLRFKQERDAAVQALASEAAFRADAKAALESQHEGASEAMRDFRLP
jgi:hypothetical protein